MKEREISRRQLLAAIGTAGGVGTLVGAGSGAVLHDATIFPTNGVVAGGLDLHVETGDGANTNGVAQIDVTFSEAEQSDSETIVLTVPPGYNPLYAWVSTTCLDDERLADALSLSLSYVDCETETVGPTIASGATFYEFADRLASGRPLDADVDTEQRDCLEPGASLCLELSWTLAKEYVGSVDGAFTLEFLGRQCRHNDGETSPFEERICNGRGKAISWVAFCAEEGTTLSDEDLSFEVEGDSLELLSAPQALDAVLLKYGTELRVFESPGQSGTFRTTSGGQTYQQDGPVFPGTEGDRTNATPCPETCGLKYEMNDGTAVLDTTQGCSQ